MASKLGTLIREARKNAGLTQEKLAKKVGGGLTASDIGNAERGLITLPMAALKKIALATGVTQASLLNAAKTTGKTGTDTQTPSSANTSMRVTQTEKKLIQYYRTANGDTKKAATNVLRGKCDDMVPSLLSASQSETGSVQSSVADMISGALGSLLGKQ